MRETNAPVSNLGVDVRTSITPVSATPGFDGGPTRNPDCVLAPRAGALSRADVPEFGSPTGGVGSRISTGVIQ